MDRLNDNLEEDISDERRNELAARSHVYHFLPVINLLHVIMGDGTPPPYQSVRTALDTMALLAALFLSIAVAIFVGVNFAELETARQRFDVPPYFECVGHGYGGDQLIEDYVTWSLMAMYLLGSCIVAVVVMILSMSVTQAIVFVEVTAYKQWWHKGPRFVFLWVIVTLISGVVCCFFCINRLVLIKFPDLDVERTNGTIAGSAGGFGRFLSTYGFTFGLGYWLIAAPFAVALGFMSRANKVSHVTLLDEFGSEDALEREHRLSLS